MALPGEKSAACLKALQEGRHEEALVLANRALDAGDLYGAFLAACACANLGQTDDFLIYLESAQRATPSLAYLHYLTAYAALLENDMEAALYQWTRIVDMPEGWLARDLIARARKKRDLASQAGQNVSDFYLLPESVSLLEQALVPEISPDHSVKKELHAKTGGRARPEPRTGSGKKNKKPPFRFRLLLQKLQTWLIPDTRRVLMILTPVLLLTLGALLYVKRPFAGLFENISVSGFFSGLLPESSGEAGKGAEGWKDIRLTDHLHVVDSKTGKSGSRKILYEYTDKESVAKDFEAARDFLGKGRINRARFLLQRILYSNADFQTIEKTRIFISFIPEPAYQEFSDPLFPAAIVKHPEFYVDCLVLWQGRTMKFEETDGGRRLRLSVRDGDRDYIAEAFLKTEETGSNWRPYEDFKLEQKRSAQGGEAIIYGKFKGLVGAQKTIYLEPIRLWL